MGHAEAAMTDIPPATPPLLDPSAPDAFVAVLSTVLLLLSLTAAVFILHFHLHLFSFSLSRRAERLRGLTSLWSVRLLLVIFGAVWALTELFRLPHLLLGLFSNTNSTMEITRKTTHLCRAYVISSLGFAEPSFFVTLLFLLQESVGHDVSTSNKEKRKASAFVCALSVSLGTAIPFLILQVLILSPYPAWALNHIGVIPDVFTHAIGGMGMAAPSASTDPASRCSFPLLSTMLLAVFGAVYVPWFVSVSWRAVTVVINKRLRMRLYFLAGAVVTAVVVQVLAFALASFWNPDDMEFQILGLAAFLAVLNCVLVGEGVLVVRPIRDAMEVGCWCGGGNRPIAVAGGTEIVPAVHTP